MKSQNQLIAFYKKSSNPKTNPQVSKSIDCFSNKKFKPQNQSIVFQTECPRLQNQSIPFKNQSIPFTWWNKNLSSPRKNQSIISQNQSIPLHLLQVITIEFCKNQRIVLHLMHYNGSKVVSGYNKLHQQYSNQETLIPRAIHQILKHSSAFNSSILLDH